MKKTIALLLAAALLSVSLIVSCGGGGDDDDDQKQTGGASEYTVSFNTDNGDPATIKPITVKAGTAVGAADWPAAPTKTIYLFKGWFEGSTEYTYSTKINKNVTLKASYYWPAPLLDIEGIEPLGEFTITNLPNQRGWTFGADYNDYAFTDNTWLLLETKGGNPNGFGGLQLTFIKEFEGEVGKDEVDLKKDWDSYTKGADEIIYWAIKLSLHRGYGDFKTAIATGSFSFYVAAYPWANLGFLNAYLVEGNLNKILTEDNKLFDLQRTDTAPNYGFIATSKDDGINWDKLFSTEFVPVTGINYKGNLIGHVGKPITLGGEVVPGSATNATIVWSGTDVADGKLTATSAGDKTVTATITNGTAVGTNFTKTFTIKISALATAEKTLDLENHNGDTNWEWVTDGLINKTALAGEQYAEVVLDLQAALTNANIDVTDFAKYTKVSVKAKFLKSDKSEISMTNTWGVCSIRFVSDITAYNPSDYPANQAYLYNVQYNFGTIQDSVPKDTYNIVSFVKASGLVLPEGISFQKADDTTDASKDVRWIKITEIKFHID